MNRGDTIDITLDYTIDGTPIEDADLDEIEFSIGTKRYTLSGEDFTTDPVTGKYKLFIDQADAFALGRSALQYQVRFRKGDIVISTDIDKLIIGATISTTVI